MAGSTSPAPVTRQANRQATATMIVGLIFLLIVLGYSTLYFGYIEGEEFASESFKRRSFSFYEIPGIGLQITPLRRHDTTNVLEQYLVAEKLVPASNKKDPDVRWDLVMAERGVNPNARKLVAQGEARILCHYLDTVDSEGERTWLEWSKKHPKLAKVLWPVVAKVANQELYFFVPELLRLGANATEPDSLQKQLDDRLAAAYYDFGRSQQDLGHHDAAVELFTEVLNHSPSHEKALAGRAESRGKLGQGTGPAE